MTITVASPIEEVAATVSETLAKAGLIAVLSGGATVWIYSDGRYKSRDLDFVTPATISEIAAALEPLGFRRTEGRHFVHESTLFTLEFPAWPLAVGRKVLRKWSEKRFAHGTIQMLSPTQCVMDRLAAFYHWKDHQALDQAIAVARAQDVNLDEVRRWSATEGHAQKYSQFLRALRTAETTTNAKDS